MAIALLISGIDEKGLRLARIISEVPELGPSRGMAVEPGVDTEDGADASDEPSLFDAQTHGDAAISQAAFPVLPDLVRIDPNDRHTVKRPREDASLAMPVLSPGDVVFVDEALGWPVDGKPGLRLANQVLTLGSATSDDEACAMVARHLDATRDKNKFHARLADAGDILYQHDAELARREPNEALIAGWLDEDGRIETHIVAHRGAYLFFETEQGRECSDVGIRGPEAPGLWLLKDGNFWSSNDWETGITDCWGLDGTLTQVSLEAGAAHFGMTPEQVIDELEDAYPYERDGDVMQALTWKAGEAPKEEGAPWPAA